MKKKKKIWLSIVAVVVLAVAIIASLPAGRSMLASVIGLNPTNFTNPRPTVYLCIAPEIQFACANCVTEPEVILACSLGLPTCPIACLTTAGTGGICPAQCASSVCNDSGVIIACNQNPNGPLCPLACRPAQGTGCYDSDGGMLPYVIGIAQGLSAITHQFSQSHDYCLPGTNNWLVEYFCAYNYVVDQVIDCTNGCVGGGMCNPGGTGYGYGYGYGWTTGTGYGYGYGYAKVDPFTKKPYIYLINVFKTYSKSVYDAAVSKIGVFKMVKFYNKKEFTPAAVSKPTALPTRK